MKLFVAIFFFIVANSMLYCQSKLTVVKVNDILFGTSFGGRERRLDHTDSGSAKFLIQSQNTADATITIILPSYFTQVDGSEKIPATFNGESAAWSTIDNVTSRTTFDPRQPLSLSIVQNQVVYIWIGGSLFPTGSQHAGKYTGSITLTVQTLQRN